MTREDDPRSKLGWDTAMERALLTLPSTETQLAARVIRQDRTSFTVDTGEQRLRAELRGRVRHEASVAVDLPIVGDWVLLATPLPTTADPATITQLIPRKSVLVRRRVGHPNDAQPLAANVDVALVVVALDRELNMALLQRAVLMAQSGDLTPVMVLSKIDLRSDWQELVAATRLQFPDLTVIPYSSRTGEGAEALTATIGPGRTATMIGPSGAGKSSLVNQLLGSEAMKTGEVRDDDKKGRHTTTHRQLWLLPSGALLIDGPGIRELGIWGELDPVENKWRDRRNTPTSR